MSRLKVGDTLTLKRQPDNPYDEKGVEIYWKDRKLGYVPKVGELLENQFRIVFVKSLWKNIGLDQ